MMTEKRTKPLSRVPYQSTRGQKAKEEMNDKQWYMISDYSQDFVVKTTRGGKRMTKNGYFR